MGRAACRRRGSRNVLSNGHLQFTVSPGAGLLRPAVQCPSPNQDDRPHGEEPSLIVIHCISLPPGEFGGPYIEKFFTNCLEAHVHPYFAGICDRHVSAHLLVRRDGTVIQFVPFGRRAWHAGESRFRGRSRCNDFSIGIELEGEDETPYEDSQYEMLVGIIDTLIDSYSHLSTRTIAGHCDIAPRRKTDPGPAFDWLRMYDDLSDRIRARTDRMQ